MYARHRCKGGIVRGIRCGSPWGSDGATRYTKSRQRSDPGSRRLRCRDRVAGDTPVGRVLYRLSEWLKRGPWATGSSLALRASASRAALLHVLGQFCPLSTMNDFFALSFSPGCFVLTWIDVVVFAHTDLRSNLLPDLQHREVGVPAVVLSARSPAARSGRRRRPPVPRRSYN